MGPNRASCFSKLFLYNFENKLVRKNKKNNTKGKKNFDYSSMFFEREVDERELKEVIRKYIIQEWN